jgi:hypothetical protein
MTMTLTLIILNLVMYGGIYWLLWGLLESPLRADTASSTKRNSWRWTGFALRQPLYIRRSAESHIEMCWSTIIIVINPFFIFCNKKQHAFTNLLQLVSECMPAVAICNGYVRKCIGLSTLHEINNIYEINLIWHDLCITPCFSVNRQRLPSNRQIVPCEGKLFPVVQVMQLLYH